jgi:hypothetical protein
MQWIMLFIVALSACTATAANSSKAAAQNPPPSVSRSVFTELRWADERPVLDILEVGPNWNSLKAWLGQPAAENCYDDYDGDYCEYSWPGVEIIYHRPNSSTWLALHVRIDQPQPGLRMQGADIQVGGPVSVLASRFPSAWAQRGEKCTFDGGLCYHAVDFQVDEESGLIAEFIYDSATEVITQIRFLMIL